MRRQLAVLCASLLALAAALGLAPLHAAATDNCTSNTTCTWTQWNNNSWPLGSSDPHCYNSCFAWPQDCRSNLPYWNGWTGQNNYYEHEVDWAVNQWNGVAECTPSFHKVGSGQGWSTQYASASLAAGLCGQTSYTGYASGSTFVITSSTVLLSTNARFYDGPPPAGAPSNSCDIKWTLLHETGHTYGEGHSSVGSDVMYPTDNHGHSIDGDAHHMLAEVYGYPSSGCPSCQFNLGVPGGLGIPPLHNMTPTELVGVGTSRVDGAYNGAWNTYDDAGDSATNTENDAACVGNAASPNVKCAPTTPIIGPPRP